jgi:hypothetical protein
MGFIPFPDMGTGCENFKLRQHYPPARVGITTAL